MMFLLLAVAVIFFVVGLFTVKLLWWVALVLTVVWALGMLRPHHRIFH